MQVNERRRGRVIGIGVVGLLAILVTAGCTAENPALPASQPTSSSVSPALTPDNTPPALQASVATGAVGVQPGDPVTVAVVHGGINEVNLIDTAGTMVAGSTTSDGATWASTAKLGYGKTYTLRASATGKDSAHTSVTAVATFTTAKPRKLTFPYLAPSDGEVVGVGEPIAVKFDEQITDKAAAEKAIAIVTTPKVAGAFYWFNDQEVRWRPQSYWAAGTKVTVDVNAYGHNLGGGIYGQEDRHVAFTIGDKVISTVDDATKILSTAVNDVVVKTMPTSMGKDSTPTEHGIFTIGEKRASMIMDSETFGLPSDAPGGYKIPVKWATRMSYGGVFVHAAPWSVPQQGVRNVSHGCLNVSTANAEWFYNQAKRGDLVIVTGTKGPLLGGTEGLGDWNIPWATWKAGGKAT